MKQINSKTKNKSYRDDILKYALEKYGTIPDYPWMSLPRYAVLRHKDNKKWYGLIMDVPRRRLGLSGEEIIDILNIKCDPVLKGSLQMQKGFLPAYHLHKGNWITILLDGTVNEEMIFNLLEMSFDLTSNKKRKKSLRSGNTEWIVPANPKYFDLEKAFSKSNTILWKQSNNIMIGDIIYMYVAAPCSAILYKCKAEEVDIPYDYNDGKVSMSYVMKISLQCKFDEKQLNLDTLKEYGVYAVRGPRRVPKELSLKIQKLCDSNKSIM